MNNDPVAIDLNVDAALLLKDLVGIDSYPSVLAVLPNIYRIDDRDRVRAVVAAELREIGVLSDDGVHPVVEQWLHCLYRPDVELAARIVDTALPEEQRRMLRLSLVRRGGSHVLAVRCDDHVVIQSVFTEGERLDAVAAALIAALGPVPALGFRPLTATGDQFAEVPSDPAERRQALLELGAGSHTATVLTRAMDEIVRRAEVLMIEHHDGADAALELCLSVLDTESGRIAVIPQRAMNGEVHSTYLPGDEATLHAGIRALVELLPGRSWFQTRRM
ncbi:ESX secretion-associated protein EspG [Nocardia sp. NBC_01327]|uniref:ESX secretion-associated protein EspG n=1 Tax=Nocardia sp. NBC_01327 TaxID=2903593 RepID=UPI002E10A5C3|nr:ESX secretion-associated protein EspG [Nocardia sp. NBC_01327]